MCIDIQGLLFRLCGKYGMIFPEFAEAIQPQGVWNPLESPSIPPCRPPSACHPPPPPPRWPRPLLSPLPLPPLPPRPPWCMSTPTSSMVRKHSGLGEWRRIALGQLQLPTLPGTQPCFQPCFLRPVLRLSKLANSLTTG